MAAHKAYDCIVIGGGHNGLVAAAYLARAGKSVCVLERRHVLGGCASSESLWPGYRVSTAAYVISLLLPEIIRDLRLKHYGLQILPRDPSSFTPLLDGRSLLMGPDEQATCREIAKFSQRDAERYPRYTADLERVAQVLEPILSQTAPDPLPLPKELRRTGMGKRMRDVSRMWALYQAAGELGGQLPSAIELLTGAARPILERWFEAEVLRATLATDAIIGAFASVSAPGTAYVLLHHVMGTAGGARGVWGYVQGGMGGLADALEAACRELHVEIRRETEVTRILTQDGRVQAIGLSDGKTIESPVVASSIDAHWTFERLLEPEVLPQEFRQAVANIDYSSASAKINLGLSALPNFTAAPSTGIAPHHRGTIHIAPTLDYIERAYDDAKYGRPSQEPVLEITLPSAVDRSIVPDGKHLMSIFVQFAPYAMSDGKSWDNVKESFADRCIQLLAALRTEHARHRGTPTSTQPGRSRAYVPHHGGQHHARGDASAPALLHAAGRRLGRSSHADQGPVLVRSGQPSGRRSDGCLRKKCGRRDPPRHLRRSAGGPLIAVVEQDLPFALCHLTAERLCRAGAADRRFTGVHKRKRVPPLLFRQEPPAFIDRTDSRQFADLATQPWKRRMVADAAEPVLRVGIVPLAAMHDAVPEAARLIGNALADRVGFVQEVVQQPQSCETAGGHVAIDQAIFRNDVPDIEGRQFVPAGLDGSAWPQRGRHVAPQELGTRGSIRQRIPT